MMSKSSDDSGTAGKRLSKEIAMAERRERVRIARIMHDELQQLLYAMQIRTDALEQGAPLEDHLVALQDLISEAAHFTRTLVTSIGPPIYESDNLASALSWLVQYVLSRYSLKVELHCADDLEESDPEIEGLLLEISRELLFNVVKHANVARAKVSIHLDGSNICLDVEDEGQGFDVHSVSVTNHGTGFGLAEIEGQLRAFGGSFQILSRPGMGTRVQISVPRFVNGEQ